MNAMKKLFLLLMALMLVLGMASAAGAETVPAETEPAAEEAVETAEVGDPVLFTVNGAEVLKSKVDDIAANLYETYTSYGYTLGEDDMVFLNEIAVNYAIQMELMNQKAVELGLDQLSEEEMTALTEENHSYWEQAVEFYMESYFGITAESADEEKADARINTLALLESMGYTEEMLLRDAVESEISGRVYAEMIKGTEVTDEDIRKAFDERVASDKETYAENLYYYEMYTQYYGVESYYIPEGYRGVTQILLPVDDELLNAYLTARDQLEAGTEGVTQEQVDEALAAVQASIQPVYDEIVAKFNAGTPINDLIAEYNTDPGMTVAENLQKGYSVHKDSVMYDPQFVAAAFSVDNIGEMSQPYVGSYGAYVVYYLRDIPGGPVELTDAMMAELKESAMQTKQQQAYSDTLEKWMAEMDIQYTEAGQPYAQ